MKVTAAVVKDVGAPFTIEDNIELHEVGPTDLQVHIVASGLCHSDEAIRVGEASVGYPEILGHEGSEIVEKVGANITDFHVILSYWTDGTCDKCFTGHAGQCRNYTEGRLDGGAARR